VRILRSDGIICYGTGTHLDKVTLRPTSGRVILRFPDIPLLAGEYDVSVHLLDETGLHQYERQVKACSFRVDQPFIAPGLCLLKHEWRVEAAPEGVAEQLGEIVGVGSPSLQRVG
jgi:hypothetical protein